MNILLNIRIFIHVRMVTRRIYPRSIGSKSFSNYNQQFGISHRDIYLLKQMIYMFTMFIVGWTPILLVNVLILVITVDFRIVAMTSYLSEMCVFGILIYLFKCNRDLKTYVSEKVRLCFTYH